jgi:hypothetical protein
MGHYQAGPGDAGQDGDTGRAAELVERVDQRRPQTGLGRGAVGEEAVKAVMNVAPIPSAAMLSLVTSTEGWGQRAAMAYPAAARARPATATSRAWTRVST